MQLPIVANPTDERCWLMRALMRTTLQLDDDVLAAARVLARQRRRSVGDVISDLARQALSGGARGVGERFGATFWIAAIAGDGFGGVVDLERVNQLRDEEA